MIQIIQGTPGSGKSAVATVDMIEFLLSGGVVACNYSLVPGWHYKLAERNLYVRLGFKDRDELAESYWKRAFKIGTSDTLYQLSDRLRALVPPGKDGRFREGAGRLYLDEAQLLFNSRTWQKNKEFIEFFTQHRKLGWDVYLIAHSVEMIDSQIRFLIEYEARLRNLRKVKLFGLLPVSPYPVFLSIVRYSGISAGAGMVAWRRLYALNKTYASLYDSMQVFAFDAAQEDVTHQGELFPEGILQKKAKPKPLPEPPKELVRSRVVLGKSSHSLSLYHPYYVKRFPALKQARIAVDRTRRHGFAPYTSLSPSDHRDNGRADR